MNASRSDIFLRVQTRRAGEVKGEAATDGHVGEIELQSWGWGVSASSAIGAMGAAERRSYTQLIVQKGIDSASTGLLNALAGNDEVKQAVLTMRKAGGEALDYIKLELSDGLISSVSTGATKGDDRLTETITLNFASFKYEYTPQDAKGVGGGAVPAQWNMAKNAEK